MSINLRDARRQIILDTAYHLFCTKGFDATSISEIINQAGGSKSTLYHHFSSKEALFVECMTAASESYITNIIACPDKPFRGDFSVLRNFAINFLRFTASVHYVAVQRLLIAEAGRYGIGKLFYTKLTTLRRHVEAYLSQLMSSGVLRKDDPQLAANHLRSLLEAEILEPLLIKARDDYPEEKEIMFAVDRAMSAFLRAYAPEEALD